jgi:predicted esterase
MAGPDAGFADSGPEDLGVTPDVGTDAGAFPCEGPAGTFDEQSLMIDGEPRFYFLHVPDDYRCERPMPVLVDFHGTAGERPEVAYRNEGLVALAEAEDFILLRPRSRSSTTPLGVVYRWDQNPGDLDKNRAFVRALLADLGRRYHLNRERTYATGFSSGTNMAAQFFTEVDPLFFGYGFLAGGLWNDPGIRDVQFGARPPRIYASTGYRDYLYFAQRTLLEILYEAGLPAWSVHVREGDVGHEFYDWQYAELWDWIDEDQRPQPGTLIPYWSFENLYTTDSLLEITEGPTGSLLVSSARGQIFRKSPLTGAWSLAQVDEPADVALPALCALQSGRVLASGEGRLWVSDDEGQNFRLGASIPERFGTYFYDSRINSLACKGLNRILAGGYWNGVLSRDGGRSWEGSAMSYAPGLPAQIASVAVGTGSTAVAAGYYYLGYSEDGLHFTTVEPPVPVEWLNDVAFAPPNNYWVVGEGGLVLYSADGGRNFVRQAGPPPAADLYAVDFWDDQIGMAVGGHGRAFFTDNGGETWSDVSTGYDRYLGDVHFLSPTKVLVVGEAGLALIYGR